MRAWLALAGCLQGAQSRVAATSNGPRASPGKHRRVPLPSAAGLAGRGTRPPPRRASPHRTSHCSSCAGRACPTACWRAASRSLPCSQHVRHSATPRKPSRYIMHTAMDAQHAHEAAALPRISQQSGFLHLEGPRHGLLHRHGLLLGTVQEERTCADLNVPRLERISGNVGRSAGFSAQQRCIRALYASSVLYRVGKGFAAGHLMGLGTLQGGAMNTEGSPRHARAPQLGEPVSRQVARRQQGCHERHAWDAHSMTSQTNTTHACAWWSTCGPLQRGPAWPAPRRLGGAASSHAPPRKTPGPLSNWQRASAKAGYASVKKPHAIREPGPPQRIQYDNACSQLVYDPTAASQKLQGTKHSVNSKRAAR